MSKEKISITDAKEFFNQIQQTVESIKNTASASREDFNYLRELGRDSSRLNTAIYNAEILGRDYIEWDVVSANTTTSSSQERQAEEVRISQINPADLTGEDSSSS